MTAQRSIMRLVKDAILYFSHHERQRYEDFLHIRAVAQVVLIDGTSM